MSRTTSQLDPPISCKHAHGCIGIEPTYREKATPQPVGLDSLWDGPPRSSPTPRAREHNHRCQRNQARVQHAEWLLLLLRTQIPVPLRPRECRAHCSPRRCANLGSGAPIRPRIGQTIIRDDSLEQRLSSYTYQVRRTCLDLSDPQSHCVRSANRNRSRRYVRPGQLLALRTCDREAGPPGRYGPDPIEIHFQGR
eukprot:scaffold1903_cov396-Prasinococcus_capsulatus_cf.AAC.15